MKENELSLCPRDVMIDDWVYYPENECYWQINIKDFRNDGNNIFWYKPIPLTKEILEFIGGQFNSWGTQLDLFNPDSFVIQQTFYQIGTFVCEVDDSNPDGLKLVSSIYGNTAYIRYFHELQHALNICGIVYNLNLDEYADMIEKEYKIAETLVFFA